MGFDLDRTRLAGGEVPVSWNILEEGDGGVIQLVYAGDVGTQFRCRGVIEGQRAVEELKIRPGTIKSPESQLRALRRERYFMMGAAILFLGLLVLSFVMLRAATALLGMSRLLGLLVFVLPAVCLGVLLVYAFATAGALEPPFGF